MGGSLPMATPAFGSSRARYAARARVLKALAHPTRLYFVEKLADGPLCVCELARGVGAELPTISRHLALLKAAGIVSDQRRGTKIYYALRAQCVLRFLDCLTTVVKQNAKEQLATVR
jgi:ArsR family transcriptional regulator